MEVKDKLSFACIPRALLLAHLLATSAELMPNARGESPPKAGAQRTLEAVGSSAMFGKEWRTSTGLLPRTHRMTTLSCAMSQRPLGQRGCYAMTSGMATCND